MDAGGDTTMTGGPEAKIIDFKFVQGSIASRKNQLLAISYEEALKIRDEARAQFLNTDYGGAMEIREGVNAAWNICNDDLISQKGLKLIEGRLAESTAIELQLEHEWHNLKERLDIDVEESIMNPLAKIAILESSVHPKMMDLLLLKAANLKVAQEKLMFCVDQVYSNTKLKEKLNEYMETWECQERVVFAGENDEANFTEQEMVDFINEGRVEGQEKMTTLKEAIKRIQRKAIEDRDEKIKLMEAFQKM